MSDEGRNSSSVEDDAVHWPPADYRAWVQSQIASKMLLRLGGFTLATAILALGAVITYVEGFEDRIIEGVVERTSDQVQEGLPEIVSDRVARALLDQGSLVADTVEAAQARIDEFIPKWMESEDFISIANEALNEITREGRAQELILFEARNRLFDPDSDAATRALAIRVYALFHPGANDAQQAVPLEERQIKPLQQTFLTLAIGTDEILPTRLVDAILEHYPMGSSGMRAATCEGIEEDCDSWDLRMLHFVLDYADNGNLALLSETSVRTFFRNLAPELAEDAINWATRNPEMQLVDDIFHGLVLAEDLETLEISIDLLSGLLLDGREALMSSSLSALAQLNPDLPLGREVRARAMERVWSSFPAEALEAAFSDRALDRQRTLGRELVGEEGMGAIDAWTLAGLARDEPEIMNRNRVERIADESRLLSARGENVLIDQRRRVYLSLLRPGGVDGLLGGPEEWAYVIQPFLRDDPAGSRMVAVAMRVSRDAAAGRDVAAVADHMIDIFMAADGEATRQQAFAVAIRNCSDQSFEALVQGYRQAVWRPNDRPSQSNPASQAFFERALSQREETYGWLGDMIASAADDRSEFTDHLLYAMSSVLSGEPIDGQVTALEAALEVLTDPGLQLPASAEALTTALLDKLFQLSARDHWAAAGIAENTRIAAYLVDNEPMSGTAHEQLVQRFSWIGRPLDATVPALTLARSTRVEVPEHDPETGYWLRLNVPNFSVFNIRGPENGTVVVFDTARREVMLRSPITLPLSLNSGEFALHFRGLVPDAQTVRLEALDDVYPSDPASATPIAVDTYTLDAGPNGGEFWMELDLANGQNIQLETMAPHLGETATRLATNSTDTVLELYAGGDLATILAEDDDGGTGTFSSLSYTAETDGPHMLRIHRFMDRPFDPGVRFALDVTTSR